ncbi:MAG TPA: TIGR02302 family protein [Enterovirga sp.]
MDETPSPMAAPGQEPDEAVRTRLDRLVSGARWALAWEQAWPAAWGALGILLLFLAVSWLGLWVEIGTGWRQIGVALFGVALAASLWPALRLRRPRREAALDRLDKDAPVGHRPARTLADTLALGSADPGSRALWALHRRRAEAAVERLVVRPPRPGMAHRDPLALRAAALVIAAGCAFVAGPDVLSRVGAAFDWRDPAAAGPLFRVDGWIDPPLYTRQPPLMIDLAAGEQRLKAPINSTLVIRVAGRGDATVSPVAGLLALPAPENPKPELREQRFKLSGDAELGIRTGLTGQMRLRIEAIPDRVPEIAFSGVPEINARGSFTLTYKAHDDYGIALAEGVIGKPDAMGGRRSLVPPPRIPLILPADAQGREDTKTLADLSEHPWAGARVKLTLIARDEAEQEGRSATIDFTLPQRPFTQPLARALVEQRRDLILDPDRRSRIQLALDSLLIAPERFIPEWGVFLGLRAASERLRRARNDTDLTEVADWLWTMALQIEEGDLTDAERQMRAAQEKLREAIERGADNEEIRRLTEELKQAMDKFLREFAQRMDKNQDGAEQDQRRPDRVISQNDLNRMLNDMQEAMKRGDVAEAQRLLDQLRNIMENLRTAQPGSRMSDPMAREMNRQMEELDKMARDQQQLRDETFREGQNRRDARPRSGSRQPNGPGQRQQRGQKNQGQGQDQDAENGQEGQQGQQGQQGLGQRQQALRERLNELQRRMRGMGMKGEQGLSDAEGAMREAENAIGQGQDGRAVDSQGRALEGLQRGMQGMAQQMQQMMGQNDGQDGEGDPNGPGNPQGRAQNDPRNDDPLGRPTRSREFSDGRVRVPTADESAVERARRILEELRRKLGDPTRPQEELDYFERLLRQRN